MRISIFLLIFSFVNLIGSLEIKAVENVPKEQQEENEFVEAEFTQERGKAPNDISASVQNLQQEEKVIISTIEGEQPIEQLTNEEHLLITSNHKEEKATKQAEAMKVQSEQVLTSKQSLKLASALMSVAGQIIWQDDDNDKNLRPDFVEVTLFQNDKELKKQVVSARENEEWGFSFDDLDERDAFDQPFHYRIDAQGLINYDVQVKGAIITSKLIAEEFVNEPAIEESSIEESSKMDNSVLPTDREKTQEATIEKIAPLARENEKKETNKVEEIKNVTKANVQQNSPIKKEQQLPQTSGTTGVSSQLVGIAIFILSLWLFFNARRKVNEN